MQKKAMESSSQLNAAFEVANGRLGLAYRTTLVLPAAVSLAIPRPSQLGEVKADYSVTPFQQTAATTAHALGLRSPVQLSRRQQAHYGMLCAGHLTE